ncbi:hypothetical protein CYLTODRAFT_423498 [Cylindrobasidium torrendii FP15055 ss-10]|uniref:AAAP amino acid permease n=1 Tax=Cylindrobasidium torrendii FP15055 ss-10 TaxID=1314674 RepID=A0A0D7BA01_9AGAR|nr:hypothetical protein CYLTODRAFT_423498 [Cylindrobasidium torrendii FP15055 ss-10]
MEGADTRTPRWTEPPSDDEDLAMQSDWIAIAPVPRSPPTVADATAPPTFQESQFDVILRRQRRRGTDDMKRTTVPSRFLNLSNAFEFSGWGSTVKTKLDLAAEEAGRERVQRLKDQKILGQFTASALAGNAVLGSVFYALPAVVGVASIYSPISLFCATVVLFLWRPIMEELGSALPITGAPYSYILNVSSKSFAIVGASLLVLDYLATSIVSAATASSYLAGEVTLPFPAFVGTIIVMAIFTLVSLSGIKESARLALAVLSLHIFSMAALIIASFVHWGRTGNAQISENWHTYAAPSVSSAARQIFDGFCLGMLGLTGFECTPAYIARIKPGRLPAVLRNLHIPAIILNSLIMVLVMSAVPLQEVLVAPNVLSLLAERTAGRWLRVWLVVDAIIVLCGGVLTGILSACELFVQLADDRVLPSVFTKAMPVTGSAYVSVISFVSFGGFVYATTGASLSIMSKMFSLVWLTVMTLFPLALLSLKFSRERLPRIPQTPLSVVLLTLAIAATVFGGNIAIDPSTIGYSAAYFVVVFALFAITQEKTTILQVLYWTYDRYPCLHRFRYTAGLGKKIVGVVAHMKRRPVCVLVKSDEIHHIFELILYVSRNEETSNVKIVHFADEEKGVPSELEANSRIVDEAFPRITVDLMVVHSTFNPETVAALAHQLGVPTSLMFMSCPGPDFPYSVADLGTRIVTR